MEVPKGPFGAAVATTGQEAKVHLPLRSTNATLTISLLKSLGRIDEGKWFLSFQRMGRLGRVAFSCHMAMDLHAKKCVGGLKVAGLSLIHCVHSVRKSLC